MFKKVAVEKSVGMVLGHDMTKIVPGQFKGVAFQRGHIIQEKDIPELFAMGKSHIYIYEPDADEVHEDEAALQLARVLSGEGVIFHQPHEGRVNILATRQGLLRVKREVIDILNLQGNIAVATLHDYQPVEVAELVAATKIFPLAISQQDLYRVETIASNEGPALQVKPYRKLKVGAIIAGDEVYDGSVQDAFAPIVREKLAKYGSELAQHIYLPDGALKIAQNILDFVDQGLEMILVCGGMSVDADDTTPAGIRQSGAEIIIQGTPVFPGAMFMLAYRGYIPVLGLPACVIHSPVTVFDLLLPLLLAGEPVKREDIARRGVGGLCRQCDNCRYPACSLGK